MEQGKQAMITGTATRSRTTSRRDRDPTPTDVAKGRAHQVASGKPTPFKK